MAKTEIRVSGFGGQGIILSGYIIGRAASIYDTKYATMTQSFGPEARGSSCSAQVIISDERILYPYIRKPEILVAMSQEACNKFLPDLSPRGTLIIDADLVRFETPPDKITIQAVPATRLAEELGRRIVMNIVMIGFFTAVTGLVKEDAVRKAIMGSIPKGTEELNMKAFEQGLAFGREGSGQGPDTPVMEEAGHRP